jgi:hypothetical protein
MPLICQAGSAEAFVGSSTSGREHKNYRHHLRKSQGFIGFLKDMLKKQDQWEKAGSRLS